jgi:hypothetical protein
MASASAPSATKKGPLATKKGQKAYHLFVSFCKLEGGKNNYNNEEKIEHCMEFLQELDLGARCLPLKKRPGLQELSCTCLEVFEDEIAQETVVLAGKIYLFVVSSSLFHHHCH